MLNADLKCIENLVKLNNEQKTEDYRWKYVSSMAGVELPIVTYSKFYKNVTGLKERSSVESFGFHQVLRNSSFSKTFNSTNKQLMLRLTRAQKRDCLNCHESDKPGWWNLQDPLVFRLPNPMKRGGGGSYDFQIFKGLKNVILHWKDAEFMIHHPVAKQFHKWQNLASMPEETFFATLIRLKINEVDKSITQVTFTFSWWICLSIYLKQALISIDRS